MAPYRMRPFLSIAALTFALVNAQTSAQTRLPDIGSSAATLLGPAQQAEYGKLMLSQLRHYDYVLEDPLLNGWLRGVGSRLGASSDRPSQPFTFFLLKDRQVNAFATLGGYIGTNAGLILAADSEDELSAVLGHEIAHVTQSHVLRSVERAQKDSIPILLAMLGAVAVATQSESASGQNAAAAALVSAQGLMAQRQIDYTRGNESEADRLGIHTMSRAGYDPDAMASMFQRLQALSRSNQGGERERTPDYLKTHPVTTTRISEAKQRAAQIAEETVTATTTTPTGQRVERFPKNAFALPNSTGRDNPLLPSQLQLPSLELMRGDSGEFKWAKERLRVLSADTPDQAIREYESMGRADKLSDAQTYGLALARMLDGQYAAAISQLSALVSSNPGNLWLILALGQAEAQAGQVAAADARFQSLLNGMPNNRAVALTYANVLSERNTPASGARAVSVLRPLLASATDDPLFQSTLARAHEISGDAVRAGEAYAEAAFLNGRPEQALVQLNTLKKRTDLDYYARARVDARIAAITPTVLELQRQGIRDEDLSKR